MLRLLHRWPGLLAAALLIALSLSGAVLSVFPAIDGLAAPREVAGQTVGDLAARVVATHPTVEQIRRAPSGEITAYWFDGDRPGAAVIDPATGADVGSVDASAVRGWITDFHRALLLEDPGRWTTAGTALVMLILAVSGAVLIMRRQGGWRRWFHSLRGPGAGRWHGIIARIAVLPLALSALTGLWMTAATFDLLPADEASPVFPAEVSGVVGLSPDAMPALAAISVNDLRDITFPYAGDAGDAFTVTTSAGSGHVDQGTGLLLSWQAHGPWAQVGEWIFLLHTGEGAALWGLILGIFALSVPVLALTGLLIWLRGRRHGSSFAGQVRSAAADTVILVASEGGSTWGFAAALGKALQAQGQAVHLGPLSAFAPQDYARAKRIVVMAATWGDGDAPASARGVLAQIAAHRPSGEVPMVILGFGDRSFPEFCGFAERLDATARAAGWPMLMPLDRIDRQSAQAFARWSRALGEAMGLSLEVTHQPEAPRTVGATLVARRDHGEAVQAPTAILRFALPKQSFAERLMGRGLGRFRPGDLLGVVPEGSAVPRYYSLASGTTDGFIEIVVRKHPGGLCSGQLLDLQPGDAIRCFVKANPGFQPDRTAAPLILVGAGTGIGPLAGFVRANAARRPMHLWFGARHPQTDLLYEEDLEGWAADGRLAGLRLAFSRAEKRQHVQDKLRADADSVRALVAAGARIMVCGGREMAQGVREAMTDILAPMGVSPGSLKAGGRYAEDSY